MLIHQTLTLHDRQQLADTLMRWSVVEERCFEWPRQLWADDINFCIRWCGSECKHHLHGSQWETNIHMLLGHECVVHVSLVWRNCFCCHQEKSLTSLKTDEAVSCVTLPVHWTTYYHFTGDHENQDSLVGIVTKLQAGWSGVKSWQGQEVFSYLMLTVPCYLVPVLRTRGAMSLLFLYAFMVCETEDCTS